ncbi:glycosyltransferase family 2 protein [Candidatus Kaiserbacteria bacterium]|nr:glycosyltransferase family 2 protein [Candidatus Kaiserbacteria bacterium]
MIFEGITYAFLFISLFFEVFLLVSFLERRFARIGASRQNGVLPSVAIVVPCFNEEKNLATTLRSLMSLEYPKELLDIIVVDDGSKDTTLAVAHSFANQHIQVIHKENGGKHSAMNLALAHTNADLIGCLDADSIVARDGLMRIIPVFDDIRVAAVTPGLHVREPSTLLQYMQHVEYRLSIFNRFVLSALGSAFVAPGPFSIFRAHVVRDLGGWRHGHSTEDMEMALRIQARGFLIANVPGVRVHTTTPRTIRALFKQRVRWTYGFLRNAVDYRHMFGNTRYGNLGLLVLPTALLSIGTGIYFFARTVYGAGSSLADGYAWYRLTGEFPYPHMSLFYVNTSALWFLVWLAIGLVLVLISTGSWIGTGSKKLPKGTSLFVLFYCFLVPTWLATALVRAIVGRGVQWR